MTADLESLVRLLKADGGMSWPSNDGCTCSACRLKRQIDVELDRLAAETSTALDVSALDPGCIRQIAENLQEADEAELLEGAVCEAAVTALRNIANEVERRGQKTSGDAGG